MCISIFILPKCTICVFYHFSKTAFPEMLLVNESFKKFFFLLLQLEKKRVSEGRCEFHKGHVIGCIPLLCFWVIRPHLTQKITHFISQVIPFYCSIAFCNTILKVLVSDSIIDLLFCWIYILGLKIPSGLKLGKCNGKSFVQVENFPQISQAVWCRCQLQTIYLRCDLL